MMLSVKLEAKESSWARSVDMVPAIVAPSNERAKFYEGPAPSSQRASSRPQREGLRPRRAGRFGGRCC
jgi:hypothetical protein